jgi:GPH family glycoside/pentoside/hexuronide:cation symporter
MAGAGSVPGVVKVGYGAGELGIAAVEFFVRVFLLKLYVDTVGLSGSLAGAVLAAAVLWDAVTDPIMGELSDRTRLRAGRRRPWIAVGSLATAVAFVVLFAPPETGSQGEKALFLLLAYLALNSALTVLAVPHAALGGELTSEPAARTEVFGWRFLFANLGLVVAIAVPALASRPDGMWSAGTAWLAIIVVVGGLVAVVATTGRDNPDRSGVRLSTREFASSFGAVLQTGPFRPLLAAYVVGSIGLTLNASLALFYYQHRLLLEEREVFLWILLPFSLVIALAIGGWVLLARWIGKRSTAFLGVLSLGVGTAIVYPLFPVGELSGPVLWGVVGGLLVGSVFLLDATVADVVDWHEAVTGRHREGVFFGFWRMASKVARAIGLVGSGFLLDAIGFVPGATEQTEHARLGLALAFGPGVGSFFVVAALIWLCVPLNEETQARVRRVLERRRRGFSSLSGHVITESMPAAREMP